MRRGIDDILRTVVVLCCLAFPLIIFFYVFPDRHTNVLWVQEEFYFVLVGATVGLAFIAFYFAYKEFTLSGNVAIHLLSLSFLLFSLLLFAQSLLGGQLEPIVTESFGTHARLLFSMFFMLGVLASAQYRAFDRVRRLPVRAVNWATAGVVGLALLYALMLRRGMGAALAEEVSTLVGTMNGALNIAAVTFLAIATLSLYAIYVQRQNPMALVLALGAAFGIESTLFFSLAKTWDITWWTAHGVVVLGLIVLTYGIVLITHSREAEQLLFDLQFSRSELDRARQEHALLQQNLERLQFVITVADSLRHEILNPHTAIRGNAQILLDGALNESQRSLVESIARQSQKVVELMDRYRSLREKIELQQYQQGGVQLIDLEKSR